MSTPLRALLWVHRLNAGLAATGVGRYSVELVRSLAALGTDAVDLGVASCAESGGGRPGWIPSDADVRRLRLPRPFVHLAWLAGGWPRVDGLATGDRPDVVHVTHPSFPVRSRSPIIYTVHDVLPLTNPDWFGRVERIGFRRSLADASRRAALTLTVSDHTRRMLCDLAGFDEAKVRTAHSGVSGRFARLAREAEIADVRSRFGIDRPYVVHVGLLTARKNLDVLLAALALGGDLQDVALVLVGPDGGAQDDLRARARQLGIAPRVHFVGFADDATLPALIQGAELLAHPSLDEGFGFTPLEAMAAATPTVVSEGGALPEIVGDAALRVVGGAEQWHDAMASVLVDGSLAARLRRDGRARASQFTWSAHAEKVLAAYEDVRGVSRPRG